MAPIRTIQAHEVDTIAIPVEFLPAGAITDSGIVALEDIPQGHKIALQDLQSGDALVRYGVVLGYLDQDVAKGALVNEHMIRIADAPDLDKLQFGTDVSQPLPTAPVGYFDGYQVEGQEYAGTRNILGIMTTVQCVAGVLNLAVEKMKAELLPKYPHVDGITVINHDYGCGVAIGARDAEIPIRGLRNLVDNPNFGGQVMLVGLGCEKLLPGMLLSQERNNPDNVIILQHLDGFHAMMKALMEMADRKLQNLEKRRRIKLPLSKLCVGMQCGGSDAFSGITANPAAGYASDLLVSAGATVLFSEVTEVRDGVNLLAARCTNEATCRKLSTEMRWYDEYLAAGGIDRDANPTPGNKQGGLANIVEKAMGSIAKSGRAPIVEVLSPGERPGRPGLIFAATPASDFVCGTMQLASGITLQVFMTGRGTPYGLAAAPVIKVSSRTDLKDSWSDLIDFDAGVAASGGSTIPELGEKLFRLIVETASGRAKPWAEQYKIHNDLCLFNPAPIT
jgi:galactarate dehydratase